MNDNDCEDGGPARGTHRRISADPLGRAAASAICKASILPRRPMSVWIGMSSVRCSTITVWMAT